MDSDSGVFPPGMGRLIGLIVGGLLLASLGVLARYTSNRDWDERKQVRDRAAVACAALARDSVGLPEVTAAVAAFEDDKQVALSVAARQAESNLRGGTNSPSTVHDLASNCRAVYNEQD
jgi:hypothetical protein